MSDETQQALAELLERANSGLNVAAGFSAQHLPDVVQQMLLYSQISAAVSLLFSVAVAAGCTLVMRNILKGFHNENSHHWAVDNVGDMSLAGMLATMFTLVVGLFALISAVIEFNTLLKIHLAPKLFVLEQARSIVGG